MSGALNPTAEAPKPLYRTIWTADVPDRSDEPLDAWLRFPQGDTYDDETDDEPDAEANTFAAHDGTFVVEWDLMAVGLVTHVGFNTYADAEAWLISEGFDDYSS